VRVAHILGGGKFHTITSGFFQSLQYQALSYK